MHSDITYQEIKECIELIKIYGYQVINAPGEADAQLAYLYKNNMVDYIVTDDLDILVFGGKKILKNFSIAKTKLIQEIDLDIILNTLNISMDQFIDIAIMSGCDYCPNIKNVGPISAYKLIKNNNEIIKNKQFNYAKEYFINPLIMQLKNTHIKKPKKINDNKLKIFLAKRNL